MNIIKSFLHLRPRYIVRMCSFASEHEINKIWPEVLLCMDEETAVLLRKNLIAAYHATGTVCPHNKALPICIYRIYEYTDEDFYDYAHRVPMSIKRLLNLELTTGYKIKDEINIV